MDPKMVERSFDDVVQYVEEADKVPTDRVSVIDSSLPVPLVQYLHFQMDLREANCFGGL